MSLSSTLAKLLHQLNLSILVHTSTKKHFCITISLQRIGKLQLEQLRELHGRLVFYLQALAVNISTTALQMTEQFLESRPSVSAHQKMVAISCYFSGSRGLK